MKYVHLVRATLLDEVGDVDAARASFERASACARNEQERRQIQERLEQLRSRGVV
jgi:predicted RNA polymerase sigma factor